MVIQNIVFDLVGVLFSIDKVGIFREMGVPMVMKYVMTHHKDPFSVAYAVLNTMHTNESQDYQVIKFKDFFLPRCISEWQQGKKTNREALKEIEAFIHTPACAPVFESERERSVINSIIKTLFDGDCLTTYMRPIDQSIMLVQDLKMHTPYRLFLLSNFDTEAMKRLYSLYPAFFEQFDGIVVSGDAGVLKPYPEMYDYLADRHNLHPRESLFIDDQYENIVGAQQRGYHTIHFKNPWQVRCALKEFDVW